MRRTIYIYERPMTVRHARYYKEMFGAEHDIIFLSDFKYRDDAGLISRQYRVLADRTKMARPNDLDHPVIIRRCRYLRAIDPLLARRLIDSMWIALDEIFTERPPDAVINLPMDNYVLDLIDQWCVRHGVFTINPLVSFLPGHVRMTRRGEYIYVRDPDQAEVEEYKQLLLSKTFRPGWLLPRRSPMDLYKLWIRELVRKSVFTVLKALKRDRYSFHYNAIFPMPGVITVYLSAVRETAHVFNSDVPGIQARSAAYARRCFFALQFAPEASLNHMIADSRFSQYEELLDTILRTLPDDTMLIVKEHPDIFGYRRPGFYDRFLNRPNVVLVDPGVSVQQLFDFCEYVLVTGSASTGVEAVVKGRTVISLGGAFYGGPSIHEIRNYDDVPRWHEKLTPIAIDDDAKTAIVRRVLSNSVFGEYRFVRTKPSQVEGAKHAAREIMNYVLAQIDERRDARTA